MGNVLTGFFAQASVAGFNGISSIKGGFLDRHYVQLGYQLLDSIVGFLWAFFITVRALDPYPDISITLIDLLSC